jgi:hypothetical protein
MTEEEILLSLSTKDYFPLDRLFIAAKELQLDSVTVAVDEDGLHSMSFDTLHYRYFEWHAYRVDLDLQRYELQRPFNFVLDIMPERPYLSALMKVWYKLSGPLVQQEIRIYKREDKMFLAARFPDFEFAFRVREESMRPQRKELRFSAWAVVYTEELLNVIKKLEQHKPDYIKLALREWVLDVFAVKDGREVSHEVIHPSRHYGEASSVFVADDFIRLCKTMSKLTGAARFEFGNNYPIKIESLYIRGSLLFVLAPHIPMQLRQRHEPHSP